MSLRVATHRLGALLAFGGAAQLCPGVARADFSAECTAPTATVADGYAGGTYVRLRVQQADANHTWVCYRIDAGTPAKVGGKVIVTGPTTSAPLPHTDSASDACSATSPNGVPGPHPLVDGSVGDPSDPPSAGPFKLDTYSASGEAWVCLQAETTKVRVVVPTPGTGVPDVAIHQDDPASGSPPPLPGPVGYPSSSCQTAPGAQPVLDTDVGPSHVWLVGDQAAGRADICVRGRGPVTAGGRLTVDATGSPGAIPSVTVSDDMTPCATYSRVLTIDSPTTLHISRSSGTSVPASVCVTTGVAGKRAIVDVPASPTTPTVTWTPDPDNAFGSQPITAPPGAGLPPGCPPGQVGAGGVCVTPPDAGQRVGNGLFACQFGGLAGQLNPGVQSVLDDIGNSGVPGFLTSVDSGTYTFSTSGSPLPSVCVQERADTKDPDEGDSTSAAAVATTLDMSASGAYSNIICAAASNMDGEARLSFSTVAGADEDADLQPRVESATMYFDVVVVGTQGMLTGAFTEDDGAVGTVAGYLTMVPDPFTPGNGNCITSAGTPVVSGGPVTAFRIEGALVGVLATTADTQPN
jgi:hypothetical protein